MGEVITIIGNGLLISSPNLKRKFRGIDIGQAKMASAIA